MTARGTAFASDFDGTLCQSNWETREEYFDPAVLGAVRAYQQAGGLFGICTGRPLFGVKRSLEHILVPDFYITTTGAQVHDRDLRPLFERTIDPDVAQWLANTFASEEMLVVAVTDNGFVNVGRTFIREVPTVASIAEVEGKLLGVSLESHGNERLARAACEQINARFPDVVEGFQNLGSVDVVAKGCSKGAGVRVVREALGTPCVAGAGDSYNDLPLLTAADVSFTFHSSPAEVRAAATHVVADLAEALRMML